MEAVLAPVVNVSVTMPAGARSGDGDRFGAEIGRTVTSIERDELVRQRRSGTACSRGDNPFEVGLTDGASAVQSAETTERWFIVYDRGEREDRRIRRLL